MSGRRWDKISRTCAGISNRRPTFPQPNGRLLVDLDDHPPLITHPLGDLKVLDVLKACSNASRVSNRF